MNTFSFDYSRLLVRSIGTDFKGNWDVDRFGPEPARAKGGLGCLRRLLAKSGLVTIGEGRQTVLGGLKFVEPHLADLEWLYGVLADNESREILIKLAAYRALEHRKVKLPLNNTAHWNILRKAQELRHGGESVDTGFMGRKVQKLRLDDFGYPIEMFISPGGIVTQFVEQQYRCETADGPIECAPGDTVIDAGGCYGDTALYFAHKAGSTGQVASFEFLPDNLGIYRKNLALNPSLAERIRIYEHPVWSGSGEELFISEMGPGTSVGRSSSDPDARKVTTLKIDDLVGNGDLEKVDFIKMDIEGAEMEALKGAENVLRKFRPKLAVTVYHDFRDFWTIPQFLDSLGLGYRFYLRHFKIHAEETVLFAIV